MKKLKIKSVKYLGKRKTYNISMKSKQHNYAITVGNDGRFIISANSHSCCYANLSYQTAYLKANYADEFVCAHLNTFTRRAMTKSASAWDQVAMMERDAKRTMDIKVLSRNLNNCKLEWFVETKKDLSRGVSQTEIRPPIYCKGLGSEPGKNIVENQPYKNLEDFAAKTSSTLVTTEHVEALIDSGFFNGRAGIKDRENIVNKFATIREDLKKTRGKGIKSTDIFD